MQFNGVVEIDESLFGRKAEYHKGRPMGQNIWIFGLVERGTNRLKLFLVDNRKQSTLTQIIQANIQTGSTIYSDGWAAYKCLPTLGYQHFVVETRDTVTGALEEVHTNRIEEAWKHAKDHFFKSTEPLYPILKVTQWKSCSGIGIPKTMFLQP